jgi:hypothetical protein
MAEPVLRREVEIPRTRSSGAAVILISAMAMFTAVGASAFVVRVRMAEMKHRHTFSSAAVPLAAPIAVTPEPPAPPPADVVPVTLVEVPATSAVAQLLELEEARDEIIALELELLATDLERGDCAAANARLGRLAATYPDRNFPVAMHGCD